MARRGLLVAVVLAVALLGLRALSSRTQESVAAATRPTATASATPSATDPSPSLAASASPTVTASASRSAAAPTPLPKPKATAQEVATQFVATWLNTSGGKKAWLARLRPLVTGELYDGFAVTDIERVPQALVGRTKMISQAGTSAVAIVSTSNGPLQITLAQQPQGWVVTSIDEAG